MIKTFKRALCLGLFSTVCIWSGDHAAGTQYQQLKYWDMCARGIKQEDLVKEEGSKSEEPDFSLPQIEEKDRVLMTYDILQHGTTDYFTPAHVDAEQQASLDILYRDLEVYTGDGKYPEANIANIVDRTWSAAGSAVLRKMLSMPLASFDQKKFQNRQSLIKELVENDAFLEQVDALCQTFANNEERMLANWIGADAVSGEVFEKCYYQTSWLKKFNGNPHAMETLTRLGNLGTTLQLTGDAITYVGYSAFMDYLLQRFALKSPDASAWNSIKAGATSLKNLVSMLYPPKFINGVGQFVGHVDEAYSQEVYRGNMTEATKATALKYIKIGSYTVPPVLAAAYLGFKAYTYKKILGQAKQTKDAINFLQEKMIGMGNVVRSVQTLQKLGNEHAAIAQGLVSWQHVSDLLHAQDDDFAKLVELLDTNTFTGESSFFSLSGRVLAAQELMKTQKNKFAGAIEVIGELDACVSVAKLYRQSADRRVGYCFVELEKTDTPYIDIKGFWNPFVDHNVVVANDIALGGEFVERNVVLTGSNTGGKSTVGLKGTLISLYLAHTFGIAPAESCNASIFTDFCSYLHILDSVASGESAFQAEINRAQALIKSVNGLKDGEFAFIVIDELFKGTSPEKGAPGAYKVIKHLAERKNVIFIIATHFKLLTELQNEVDSVKNMKLEIYEDEDGNLVKPYKLEDGISTQNIADILMESGLDIAELDFA